jgi:hypothetical protein
MQKLYGDPTFCDVVFKTQHGLCLECHRIVLVAALPSLKDIMCKHEKYKVQKSSLKPISRSSSAGSGWEVGSKLIGQIKGRTQDTLWLLDNDTTECSQSGDDAETQINPEACQGFVLLDHPIFYSGETTPNDSKSGCKTVVSLNDNVPVLPFQHILQYMYTWCLDDQVIVLQDQLEQVKRIAEVLGFSVLINYINNLVNGEDYMNDSLTQAARLAHQDRLKEMGLRHGLCSGNQY